MMSPSEIKDAYTMLSTAAKKIAVVVVTHDNQRHLVTQNREIISLFHPTKGYKDFNQNLEEENTVIECYEIRYNKTILIDASNVHYLVFIGIPEEVPPPLYLNPRFEGTISSEALIELQTPSLLEIKEARDKGYFKEVPYDEDKVQKLLIIKSYIEERLKLSFDDHPVFKIYRNKLLNDFHLYSNIVESDKMLDLAEKIYFMPAILTCYNQSVDNISKKQIIEFIDNDGLISNLKEKWIERLNKYKNDYLLSIEKEMKDADSYLDLELKDKLSINAVVALIKRVSGETIEIKQSKDAYEQELIKLIDIVKKYCSEEFVYNDEIKTQVDALINTFIKLSNNAATSIIPVFTQEAIKHHINSSVNSILQIKDQYGLVVEQTKQLDFAKDLQYIDDYRLFLRYWPNIFQTNETFHDVIRPLTTLELQVINCLLREGVDIEYNKLFPGFINEAQAYNSVLNELQDKADIMREKRLAQIETVAQERVKEIKAEMDQLYDTMGDDEKKLFNDMIDEISDVNKYKEELNNEPRLLDILMYWPLPLYPRPDYVVQS